MTVYVNIMKDAGPFYIHTVGKISIEHLTNFLSKYISNGSIAMKFSPCVVHSFPTQEAS